MADDQKRAEVVGGESPQTSNAGTVSGGGCYGGLWWLLEWFVVVAMVVCSGCCSDS